MKSLLLIFLILPGLLVADSFSEAIKKATGFLVKDQNPDGSYGSAGRTKSLNIYAPGPGAHVDFKTATSALCLMALCQLDDDSKAVKKALTKCNAYLLKTYPLVKRVDGRWVGNVWSHTYIVRAMLAARKKGFLSDQKTEIDKCINDQVKQLGKYQYLDGGWGYYDFAHKTDIPSGSSTSFLTASVLIALKEAEEAGFKVSLAVVKKGLRQLTSQRRQDNCFLYARDFYYYRNRSINRPQGSLGRNHPCLKALYLWKEGGVSEKNMEEWVGKLIKMNGWLDMGRKRPVPHESWYAVAGYFYYYGHFYAGQNLENCVEKKKLALGLGKLMVDRQEKNGSWFDYPLYDYGHYYGTAYALMTLLDCQKAMK